MPAMHNALIEVDGVVVGVGGLLRGALVDDAHCGGHGSLRHMAVGLVRLVERCLLGCAARLC